MDYWEKVPGIDEGKIYRTAEFQRISDEIADDARKNADFQNLIGDLNSAISAIADLKKQVLQKNPATAKRSRKTLAASLKYIDKGMKSVFGKEK
jgi:hypothetical protein